jgi:anti-sigma regulatory factor (Ser/Thr protein kinase)
MSTTTLVLPGTLDALEPLGDFVRAAAGAAGFDSTVAGRLHLAVDEVATNVITHAYEERGLKGELCLIAETDPAALRIHLEDTGVPYDPTQQEAFLYERRGDRNRVTFVLNRPPAPAP